MDLTFPVPEKRPPTLQRRLTHDWVGTTTARLRLADATHSDTSALRCHSTALATQLHRRSAHTQAAVNGLLRRKMGESRRLAGKLREHERAMQHWSEQLSVCSQWSASFMSRRMQSLRELVDARVRRRQGRARQDCYDDSTGRCLEAELSNMHACGEVLAAGCERSKALTAAVDDCLREIYYDTFGKDLAYELDSNFLALRSPSGGPSKRRPPGPAKSVRGFLGLPPTPLKPLASLRHQHQQLSSMAHPLSSSEEEVAIAGGEEGRQQWLNSTTGLIQRAEDLENQCSAHVQQAREELQRQYRLSQSALEATEEALRSNQRQTSALLLKLSARMLGVDKEIRLLEGQLADTQQQVEATKAAHASVQGELTRRQGLPEKEHVADPLAKAMVLEAEELKAKLGMLQKNCRAMSSQHQALLALKKELKRDFQDKSINLKIDLACLAENAEAAPPMC